jgi:hypothetical protein
MNRLTHVMSDYSFRHVPHSSVAYRVGHVHPRPDRTWKVAFFVV